MFLRLSGCNIGSKRDCPWCDTEFSVQNSMLLSVEAVRDRLLSELDNSTGLRSRLVVVTGGEPLLQWGGLLQMFLLLDRPQHKDLTFQFETNGMYLTADIIADASTFNHINVQFVVSPKIPAVHGKYSALPDWWFSGPAKWAIDLKYVVTANEEDPYHELPFQITQRALQGDPLPTIWVSGMTVYDEIELQRREDNRRGREAPTIWSLSESARLATAANYRHAARLALSYGFHLSYQTHLLSGLE